jgi:2'-5' RNA ligase
VRVFIALDVSDPVRERIADFARVLRAKAPEARWVRTDAVHVTLKFIGEAPPAQVDRIRMALEPVRASGPVEMSFRGAGFFPDEQRPRVFWVGIDATPTLADLAGEIEQRLEPLGIARESRSFRPHLTLARIEGANGARNGVDALRRALGESRAPEFGKVVERTFHLYESRLGPGGARYTRLQSFVFAPEAE